MQFGGFIFMTQQLELLTTLKKLRDYLIFTEQEYDFKGLNSAIKRLEEETYWEFWEV